MNEAKIRIGAIDDTKRAFASIDKSFAGLKENVLSVKGAIAGIIGGAVVGSFLQANRSFQSLQASLLTFTGSAEEAARQFKILQNFAATTPFELEEIVGGFNKLVARGMNPTIESFKSFGNIAAGTGKTLDQFIEAVADAVTGEFERLKEFGIKASKEGEKVKLIFGGMSTTIANNANEIEGYLRQLGDTKFAGAMERQANTLNGAISNLNDAFFSLATSIGESGINQALTSVIRSMSEFVNLLNAAFKPENEKQINKLQLGINELEKALDSINQKSIKSLADVKDEKMLRDRLNTLREQQSVLKKYQATLETTAKVAEKKKTTPDTKPLADLVTFAEAAKLKIRDLDEAFALEELPQLETHLEAVQERLKDFDYENIKMGKTALEEYALAARNLGYQLDNVATRSLQGLEDGLVGVFMGTMSVKDAFRSMATSIVSDLARIAIQRMITGPIADALFGPLQTAGQGGTGYFGGIKQSANGNPLGSRMPTIVGERGPELFVPSVAGKVVPNHNMGMGDTVVVNQTINLSAGVSQTVRAEVMNMMPRIMEATKGAVADAKRRGGTFAKAFA